MREIFERIPPQNTAPGPNNAGIYVVCPKCGHQMVLEWRWKEDVRTENDSHRTVDRGYNISAANRESIARCLNCHERLFSLEDRGTFESLGYYFDLQTAPFVHESLYRPIYNIGTTFFNSWYNSLHNEDAYELEKHQAKDYYDRFAKINEWLKESDWWNYEYQDFYNRFCGPLFERRRTKQLKDIKDTDASLVFQLMRHMRRSKKEEEKTVQQLVSNLYQNKPKDDNRKIPEDITDSETIQQYLYHLMVLESNEYALTTRLPDLLLEQKEAEYRITVERFFKSKEQNEVIIRYEELKEKGKPLAPSYVDFMPKIMKKDATKLYPRKPEKPKEPIIIKQGIFNKKKVQTENEKNAAQYEKQIAKWKEDLNEWSDLCNAIDQEIEDEYNAELEKAKPKAIAEAEEKGRILIRQYEAELEEAKKECEDVTKTLKDIKESIKNPFDSEVKMAKQLLADTIETKNKMLNANVIFPKYRNLVAYSTMYEYFATGRCNSLKGPDGAYNLYESEIRANLVIEHLSTIMNQLESIKSNQYMIYNQLTEINQGISKLNTSMRRVIDSSESIERSNEIIAYNTAATAYYSKLNAELTEALDYMVAFSSW